MTFGITQEVRDEQFNQEQLALSETMVGWSEKYPDVEVLTSLPKDASAVLALTEAASGAELLVVGSRGQGGFRNLLMGCRQPGRRHPRDLHSDSRSRHGCRRCRLSRRAATCSRPLP